MKTGKPVHNNRGVGIAEALYTDVCRGVWVNVVVVG